MSTKTGTRQARAIKTRSRLMEQGMEAFSRLGHDGVNLKTDILEPAGVSVGSFYHQFTDKTDLLLNILADTADLRRSAVMGAGRPAADLRTWVTDILTSFFQSLEDDTHGWRLQLLERSNRDPRIREAVDAGRSAWAAELADSLTSLFGMSPHRAERAAEMMVAHAIGMATLHLESHSPGGSGHGDRLLDGIEFILGGLNAISASTRITPPTGV